MPDFIQMQFGGVSDLASTLSREAQQNLDHLLTLANRADPTSVWQGDSADAYRTAFDRFHKAEANLQTALTELSRQVTIIRDHFDEINRGGQAAFNQFLD
jgi:WXG100 family type VII secretion target